MGSYARWLSYLVSLSAAVLVALPVGAQTIQEYVERFRALDANLLKQDAKVERRAVPESCELQATRDFWAILEEIQKESEEQKNLRGSASLGYQGDEVSGEAQNSGISNQHKVEAGLEMRRGSYPGEFEFASSVGVRIRDGKFEEDVSKFDISYDRYVNEHVQPFVYASRFTDSFLNIDQRYEVGTGVFLGSTFGMHREDKDKHDKLMRQVSALKGGTEAKSGASEGSKQDSPTDGNGSDESAYSPTWYRCYEALAGTKAAETDPTEVEEKLRKMGEVTLLARKKRAHVLRAGVVFGAQAELEQATVTSTTRQVVFDASGEELDDPVEKKVELSVPSAQRYRWVIRPTVSFQPSPRWTFDAKIYWKLPLGGDREVLRPVRGRGIVPVSDWRRDTEIDVTFEVDKDEFGQPGKLSLTLSFRQYLDNAPPLCARLQGTSECEGFATLLQQHLDGETQKAIETFVAPRKHEVISLEFNLSW